MKLLFKIPLSAALTAATFVGASAAHEWYAGGSASWMDQADSSNRGVFSNDFNAGPDGTNPASVVPSGTSVGWDTDFDDGYAISGEVGVKLKNGLRGALEVSFSEADVSGHTGTSVGGNNVDGADVALLTGAVAPVGTLVGETLANGRGEVENTSAFANVYYDFENRTGITPYVGAGIGVSHVEVNYNPSGVAVVQDSETKFAYQGKVGATYELNDRWEVFGEYTYRATDDVKVNSVLVPAKLRVENEQQLVGVGLRYRFGH